MTRLATLAGAALAVLAFSAPAHRGAEVQPAALFVPPAPGTYVLPPIQPAPEGQVLAATGSEHDLRDYTRGRITLLGLVYTRCADPEGCPVATWAFSSVRRLLRAEPDLERRARLVTLSFDPVHDRPEVMAAYERRVRGARAGAEWHFLTTASRQALAPILEGLNQDLRVAADSRARPGTEEFTHTLKVFLIDAEGQVREIYSSGYLVPQMIVNDMRTLAGDLTRIR
jgi:cytochrome oxidase Cu insertion factor (SCO1/SenC/PrrC family)